MAWSTDSTGPARYLSIPAVTQPSLDTRKDGLAGNEEKVKESSKEMMLWWMPEWRLVSKGK